MLRPLLLILLSGLIAFQALAGVSVTSCHHTAEHAADHTMTMTHAGMDHSQHQPAPSPLSVCDCGCPCAATHCATSCPALSPPPAGMALRVPASLQLADARPGAPTSAHDHELIRPPSST